MDDKTIAPPMLTPRDWAGIALREALDMAGTPEGAAKLAESKRYAALADALQERDKLLKRQADELEALRADAERYRWLRDVSTATWRSFQEQWRMPREKCDAAIDAARAGGGNG